MRIKKVIIAGVVISLIAWGMVGGNETNDVSDINDLSAYYGFEEIEIIKLDRGISNLRTADFNGDGLNDIAIVNNRKAKIEILVQKETIGPGEEEVAVDPDDVDVNQINPPTRFDKQSVPVSQKMGSLVCGDFNNDGMVDLAFYGEPKGLYVILQKAGEAEPGQAKTLSWRTRKKIKIDKGLLNPNALVSADLNNDGLDDLVLAGQDSIYIVYQEDDGSLGEPVEYATASRILGIKIGDLNGDGVNDLVLVTSDNEKPIQVRFGLQTGQLGPQIKFFIEKPYALELKNIDEEAGDEVLIVNSRSGRLICYKFTVENEKDADWPISFYPLASGEGSNKRDLVVGDFDGDGLADVVISEPGAAEVVLYKQAAGLGLLEPVRFPGFADIESLSVADIDGDGKSELAVMSVKEKVIGLSEFEDDRLSFPKPIEVVDEPLAGELADVDGDGKTDCVYISKDANDVRTLRVIYNVAAVGKPVKKPLFGPKKKVGEIGAGLVLEKLSANPDGLRVIDVDQDGLGDVLIFVKYEKPVLVRQVKKGKFEIVDSPKAQGSLIKDASLSSIAVADVDAKAGRELLVAQKNFARSLVFADGEKWSIVDQYNAKSTEDKVSAVAVFNLDGDERPAILLLNGQKGQLQILKAGEDKTYRFEKELDVGKWTPVTHLKMLFAPLTGGDAKNILLFDSEKFALITPPTESDSQQRLEQQFNYETKIKDGVYGNLITGDINSDGRSDIIMVEYRHNHIEILALDSEIKPTPAMRFKIFEQKSYRGSQNPSKASIEPRELKIADVTGDGKDDLVIVIHDRIIIYPQD